jgi:hypothetical protein
MLKICPFRYTRFNPETGYNHASADNPFPDDKQRTKFCNYGKGPWCEVCPTYRQSLVTNEKWKQRYNRMGKEGMAPHLWRKPNPERITNPIEVRIPTPLRLRNNRGF